VIAKCAKTRSHTSGMKAQVSFQKNLREAPKATEGTIIGMSTSTFKADEKEVPSLFLATTIAIGKPTKTFKTVTIAPREYERIRLCQYSPQGEIPAKALGKMFFERASKAGSATNNEGTSTIVKKTKRAMLFLVIVAEE